MSNKKYGLVLPDKGTPKVLKFQASRNVFGDDSDSDKETRKPFLPRPSANVNRQAKITQEKAVIEDPTVFQYDEIYDDMVGSKEKEKKKTKEDVKPRYIENLMKTANKRKIENERRIERQIQKERENEGEEFKDKEVFVTSAYKKKLEEMREEEEKEKREEYLESIGDVTKQSDLGGFYRHLYEQKLGPNKPSDSNKTVSEDNKKDEVIAEIKTEPIETFKSEPTKKRNYRKRKSTENQALSEGEIEDSDEEVNRLNLENIKLSKKNKAEENIDADSDFSIDESTDEEVEKKNDEKQQKEVEIQAPTDKSTNKEAIQKKTNTPENDIKTENKSKEKDGTEIVPEIKPKIDIWKKRTVGVVFDEALKRFYERKAARGC